MQTTLRSAVASTSAVRLDTTHTLRSVAAAAYTQSSARASAPAPSSFSYRSLSTSRPSFKPSTETITPPTPTPPPSSSSSRTKTSAAHRPQTIRKPDEPEEPNVYKGDSEPGILLTDRAIAHLTKIAAKQDDNQSAAFRIAVEPGGCHGYQYKMEIEHKQPDQDTIGEEDDFVFQANASESSNIQPIPILIDSISLTLLRGSTIDYVTELIGSQFSIKDNPQAKGAGCGCGVSWEPIV
ncbi:unnamed protein product [Sympodiomycopsis kandeliae]